MISIPTVQNLKKMEVVIKGSNSQPIMGEKKVAWIQLYVKRIILELVTHDIRVP